MMYDSASLFSDTYDLVYNNETFERQPTLITPTKVEAIIK